MDVNERYANQFLLRFKKNKIVILTNYEYKDQVGWNILVKRGLIEHVGDTQFTITLKGMQVLDCGSWTKYLELEQTKEEKRHKKEEFDYKISKFHAKSKYLPYFISFASLFVACLAYFKPTNNTKNKLLSKDEIIHIADSISTSNQIKANDSLPYINSEPHK
ncbi:hypothetical protein [Seonamhaeicola sp.]|uniref:hypothetical protein n=1 Tax=Seonamhaeicola sp. TaxID=1912245 RepID=UPI0026071ABE|nr:hypothetical protein [Seonamhaeicola sp.]